MALQYKVIANQSNLSRQEWLEKRSNYLGGSDAAAAVGLNPWKSPFQVWLEKRSTTHDIPPQEDSLKLWYGRAAEDMIAKRFEMETGKKTRRNNSMMVSCQWPWMLADIDREVVGENAILEIKTSAAWNRDQWKDGGLPIQYEIQCHHYMAVTGAEKCYIAVMFGAGDAFEIRELDRDEELIQTLAEEESAFWSKVVNGKMPDPDGSQVYSEALAEMFPGRAESKQEAIELDSNGFNLDLYFYAIEQAKQWEEKAKKIEQEIKIAMQDDQRAVIGGRASVSWTVCQSTRLDAKKLREELPEIFEKYAKTSEYRRFHIKKIEEETE